MKAPAKKSKARATERACATVILVDGKLWTGNAKQSEAEALAMSENRILAVGGSKEILKLRDSKTKVIDLRGRRAVPGFNDAHLHFYMGGASLAQIQLGLGSVSGARAPHQHARRSAGTNPADEFRPAEL